MRGKAMTGRSGIGFAISAYGRIDSLMAVGVAIAVALGLQLERVFISTMIFVVDQSNRTELARNASGDLLRDWVGRNRGSIPQCRVGVGRRFGDPGLDPESLFSSQTIQNCAGRLQRLDSLVGAGCRSHSRCGIDRSWQWA